MITLTSKGSFKSKLFVAPLLLITLSASTSFSAPPLVRPAPSMRHSKYPWGGIDWYSHVYWPVSPPDVKPLQLVKGGKQQEAFDYCLSKLKTTQGDLRFFYTVQAASLGFGIWQTHRVVGALLPTYRKAKKEAWTKHESLASVDPGLLLGMAFAVSLADTNSLDERTRPAVIAWEQMMFRDQATIMDAYENYSTVKSTRLEHRAVVALIAADRVIDTPSGRERWKLVLRSNPSNSGLNLVMSTLYSRGFSRPAPNGKSVVTEDIDEEAMIKYAEAALSLDPTNVRAMYQVANFTSHKTRSRSIALLERYLQAGTGPVSEIEAAKKLLARLSSPNS